MLLIIVLLTLFTVIVSGITTIPFSIGLLTVTAAIFRKSWIFFLALGLGLFLDLALIRTFGLTSLIFIFFVLLIRLYEGKFETQTGIFVFIFSFLGSLIYLMIFDYNNVLIQSLVNALISILFFKLLWSRLAPRSETI
jgi:hypothetical protein